MTTVLGFLTRFYEFVPPHFLFLVFGVAIVAGLMLYFWVWYRWPRSQVPIHFSAHELKVLEVQDQIRKTQIQIPIVVALVAIFIMVLIQFGINSRQWTTDFELRNVQAQANQFADAVRALSEKGMDSHVAGIYSLQYLVGLDVDRNIRRVNEMLASTVRSKTTEEELRHSVECNEGSVGRDKPQDREEAAEDVQAALNVIGNKLYAGHFDRDYDSKQNMCPAKSEDFAKVTTLARRPILEHRFLDNLNLAETDFSCTRFSGSRFRRTSFQYANLQGSDFRSAIFENRDLLGLKDAVDELRRTNPAADVADWMHKAPENGWRRYRCWSTFFQNAFLDGADFTSAQLSGAVFEGASLKDTVFKAANITLADFRGAIGLTKAQLELACVWDNGQPLMDGAIKTTVPACQWDGK